MCPAQWEKAKQVWALPQTALQNTCLKTLPSCNFSLIVNQPAHAAGFYALYGADRPPSVLYFPVSAHISHPARRAHAHLRLLSITLARALQVNSGKQTQHNKTDRVGITMFYRNGANPDHGGAAGQRQLYAASNPAVEAKTAWWSPRNTWPRRSAWIS